MGRQDFSLGAKWSAGFLPSLTAERRPWSFYAMDKRLGIVAGVALTTGLMVAGCASGLASVSAPCSPQASLFNSGILDTPPATSGPYPILGFDRLAGFPVAAAPAIAATGGKGTPPTLVLDQVPAVVKRFDGQKVVVTGYMLPTAMKNHLVTEFLLLRCDQMCGCNGGPLVEPSLNEFVSVRVPLGVKDLTDHLVSCIGTLHMREERDGGYTTSIYQLDGETVAEAANLSERKL